MSIYTRTGDGGETSLADGSRIAKDSARVEAYGALDEAGSWVGSALAAVTDSEVDEMLRFVQQRLMNCASLAATPPGSPPPARTAVTADDVAALERAIDTLDERVPGWNGFVLQGGGEAAARLHVARTVVRRAERRLVTLDDRGPGSADLLAFVNRTSDLLYAAARCENAAVGIDDTPWDPAATPGF